MRRGARTLGIWSLLLLVPLFGCGSSDPGCVDREEADRRLQDSLASHQESFHQQDARDEADALHRTAAGLLRLAETLEAEPEAARYVTEGASHYEAAARLVEESVADGDAPDGEIYARSVAERGKADDALEGLLRVADDLAYC